MKIKVGDKVRLKSLDEILGLVGFYKDEDDDIIYNEGWDVALMHDEVKYCGKVFEVKQVETDGFLVLARDGFELYEIPDVILDLIEEPTNPNLVNLEQATIALINGECEAIRYHTNNSICAYRDIDTGVFKVAKYQGENLPMYYTDKLFFMHEGYIIDSKWELIVDNVKREQIKRHKQHLIATLDSLFLLSGIDEETYEMFMNKAEVI